MKAMSIGGVSAKKHHLHDSQTYAGVSMQNIIA
jgi:hypothetical protein